MMKRVLKFWFLVLLAAIPCLAAEEGAHLKPEALIEVTPPDIKAKGGGDFIIYFKNFPPEEEIVIAYTHVIQKTPGEFQEMEKLKIDGDGRICIQGTPVAFYTFGAEGIAKGERVKYRFSLADGTLVAESSFIPYPLVVRSKKGTFSIHIELLQLEPMVYSLTYQGLNRGERMRLRSIAGGEIDEEDFFYYPNYVSTYMPGVAGEAGGYALLDVARLAGDVLKVQVPWGSEVLQRVAGLLPEVPELQAPAKKSRTCRSR